MEIRKLARSPYANARVIIDSENNTITLVSYRTVVCVIEGGWLTCTGTYSNTTRRHINRFMSEYAAPWNYYTAKDAYTMNHKINIETGEVIPL